MPVADKGIMENEWTLYLVTCTGRMVGHYTASRQDCERMRGAMTVAPSVHTVYSRNPNLHGTVLRKVG